MAAALACFVLYRSIFIAVMWWGRSQPPMPSDSYHYIWTIREVTRGTDPLLAKYPGYAGVLGYASRATGVAPQDVYFLSFFAGTLLMGLAVLVLLRALYADHATIGAGLVAVGAHDALTMSLLWVTPNYVSVALFLLVLGLAIGYRPERSRPWRTGLVAAGGLAAAALYVLVHRSGLYYAAIYLAVAVLIIVLRRVPRFRACLPSRAPLNLLVVTGVCLATFVVATSPAATDGSASALSAGSSFAGADLTLDAWRQGVAGPEARLFLLHAVLPLALFAARWPRVALDRPLPSVLLAAALAFTVAAAWHPAANRAYLILFPLAYVVLAQLAVDAFRSPAPRRVRRTQAAALGVAAAVLSAYTLSHALHLNYAGEFELDYASHLDLPAPAPGGRYVITYWLTYPFLELQDVDPATLIRDRLDATSLCEGNVVIFVDHSLTHFRDRPDHPFERLRGALDAVGGEGLKRYAYGGDPSDELRVSPAALVAYFESIRPGLETRPAGQVGPFSFFEVTRSMDGCAERAA